MLTSVLVITDTIVNNSILSIFACVSLSTPQGPVTVTVVYRQPGAVTAAFLDEFSSLLESLAVFNSQLLIAGDLNVHFDDSR